MIFVDQLLKYEQVLRPEFEKLGNDALAKQAHDGDMLIWFNNGFYDEGMANFKTADGGSYNPHVVGPGAIGHSEQAHYRFIHKYREAYLTEEPYADYLTRCKYTPERREEIDQLIDHEETTIQLEMLVYLKFWESDSIIKKFYELVRMVHGEPYDWYFQIAESNRAVGATGTRQEIIRKHIRNRLEANYPEIYKAIKIAYKTQIRNAIAHSQYSFQGPNIHIHNAIEGDQHNSIQNLTFQEWSEMFHLTMVLYNEYIRLGNTVAEFYKAVAEKYDNVLPIQVTEKTTKTYLLPLQYRPVPNSWGYKQG